MALPENFVGYREVIEWAFSQSKGFGPTSGHDLAVRMLEAHGLPMARYELRESFDYCGWLIERKADG